MNCPDVETLISYALSPDGCNDIANHILKCSECRKNLEIIHETMLAENFAFCPSFVKAKPNAISDLIVSLSRTLRDGYQNAIKWVDDLIPDFDREVVFSYATRAAVPNSSVSTSSRWSFSKPGEGCSLKIEIELADCHLIVRTMFLEAVSGKARPFELTVVDAEDGSRLLDKRHFSAGSAILRGVEKGSYVLTAVSDGNMCELALKVE